jgi:hypothetical protein
MFRTLGGLLWRGRKRIRSGAPAPDPYGDWIRANAPRDPADAAGACGIYCDDMRKVFPELKLITGHYSDPLTNSMYEHFWLEAPDGSVVDPTAIQFPTRGYGSYHPLSGEQKEEYERRLRGMDPRQRAGDP